MRISDWSSDVCSSDLLEAISLAQRLHPLDEQIAERERLAAHLGHVGFEDQVDTDFERREPEHRGRPALKTLDPGGGVRIVLEGEGSRSEERRVGKGGGSTGRSRWLRSH